MLQYRGPIFILFKSTPWRPTALGYLPAVMHIAPASNFFRAKEKIHAKIHGVVILSCHPFCRPSASFELCTRSLI